jgi:hypothetical protein
MRELRASLRTRDEQEPRTFNEPKQVSTIPRRACEAERATHDGAGHGKHDKNAHR